MRQGWQIGTRDGGGRGTSGSPGMRGGGLGAIPRHSVTKSISVYGHALALLALLAPLDASEACPLHAASAEIRHAPTTPRTLFVTRSWSHAAAVDTRHTEYARRVPSYTR